MKVFNEQKKPARLGWLWGWLGQAAVMTAACGAASLCEAGPVWLSVPVLWLGVPTLGAVTACGAVKRGLSNYLAWIAPPALLYVVHLLVWGYVPPVSAALVTAFVSVVGAAAGEVLVQRGKR